MAASSVKLWPMLTLFTDFTEQGPYAGQMQAVLHQLAPEQPVVTLMHDAPSMNPRAAAYLLAALVEPFETGTVFLCVVDPGVGSERRPVVLQTDRFQFVGPDNGLLSVVAKRAAFTRWSEVLWRPDVMSNSFHGRDLFAPVAAKVALRRGLELRQIDDPLGGDWPEDLAEVIYVDAYGNLVTGLRAESVDRQSTLSIAGQVFSWAKTFADVPQGVCFCYANSMGLVEVAANGGSAAALLNASIGSPVQV